MHMLCALHANDAQQILAPPVEITGLKYDKTWTDDVDLAEIDLRGEQAPTNSEECDAVRQMPSDGCSGPFNAYLKIRESEMGGCLPKCSKCSTEWAPIWFHNGNNDGTVLCGKCALKNSLCESDPNGIDPHGPGAKLDAGKLKAALVMGDFARALTEVIRVGTFGANKYSAHGWLSVPSGVDRYTDAMQRHFLTESKGEIMDPDSNIMHAAHLAWNALARLELMLRGGSHD
jgi:hypothetical protein